VLPTIRHQRGTRMPKGLLGMLWIVALQLDMSPSCIYLALPLSSTLAVVTIETLLTMPVDHWLGNATVCSSLNGILKAGLSFSRGVKDETARSAHQSATYGLLAT
jgi:hypothetical protein